MITREEDSSIRAVSLRRAVLKILNLDIRYLPTGYEILHDWIFRRRITNNSKYSLYRGQDRLSHVSFYEFSI